MKWGIPPPGVPHSERRLRRREREHWHPDLRILAVVGGAAPFPPERPCEEFRSRNGFREIGFLAPSWGLAGAFEKQSQKQNLEGRCPSNTPAGE
jgi:hypothetical protein